MANSRKLIVEVVGDSSKLDRTLKGTETRLQKFGRKAGVGGGVLGGVGKAGVIGAGVAVGAAVALTGLKRVTDAAKEAQIAQANLDQAFEASGISAAKFGKQTDKAIQSMSRMSAFDDEEVSASFASLLRTTGSLEKATRDAGLAANIARARRISLAAATKIVEKAEIGQTRGLKAVGVELKAGVTATEAIEAAQRKFAGSAERYGKTAAGAQEKFAVALENIEERIGAKLLPVLTKLLLKGVEFLDWAEKNWPKFAKAVEDSYRIVKPIIDAQIAVFKGIGNAVEGMVKIVHGVFTGDWREAWEGFKQYAIDGVGGVVKAVLTLPAKLAKALGTKLFDGIEKALTATINKAIDLLNKAIKAYNKIPLLPNVSTITKVGGETKPTSTGRRPDEGTRGPQVVEARVYIDGRELNARTTQYRQQAQRRNPPQRRGPNAGLVSG